MIVGINLIAQSNEKSTGAFRYVQLMLQAMGEYELDNCKFIVYHQEIVSQEYLSIPKSLNVEYVQVPAVGSGLKRILFEQTKFYSYLKPCDVLYSYCTSLPLFVKAKKIFTLHDIYYLTMKDRYSWLQTQYLKLITSVYLRRCDKVLTVSEYSYSEILKYTCCKKEKLDITYNFLLPKNENYIPSSGRITSLDGEEIDITKPYFLYVGNLQPGKNVVGMVEGFEQFCNRKDDYQLLIVGQPRFNGEDIKNKISSIKNVKVLGYQSRENVEFLFSNCLAVVLLSFCEGFGIPPLEGFGYGKPALTSNLMSLPEVVGKAGCLVNPYHINEIAEGFKQIIENNQEYIKHIPIQLEKFDFHNSVEKFMDTLGICYKRICKS